MLGECVSRLRRVPFLWRVFTVENSVTVNCTLASIQVVRYLTTIAYLSDYLVSISTMLSLPPLRIAFVPGSSHSPLPDSPPNHPSITLSSYRPHPLSSSPLTTPRTLLRPPPLRPYSLLTTMHTRPLPLRHRPHDRIPPIKRDRHGHRSHRRLGRRTRQGPGREQGCGLQNGRDLC